MPNWAGYAYTKKGRTLQAKVEAGEILEITRVVLGDGGIPADIENMNDLVSPKLEAPIVDIAVNGTTCTVSVLVSNIGFQSSIYPSEAGIFAKDPDLGEILLLYIRDSNPDYLPAEGSAVVVSEKLNFHIGFSIAPEVNIQLNPAGLVTVEMFMKHEKINRIWYPVQEVEVGDIRYSKRLESDSYKIMECIAAGTTGTTEPTWGVVGSTVTDGTVQWRVCDIRDTSVGTSQGRRVVLGSDSLIDADLLPADVVKFSDFTQSFATNGWTKLPNGLILQWFSVTFPISNLTYTNGSANFPISFPNQLLSISGVPRGEPNANGGGCMIFVNSTSKTGLSARLEVNGNSTFSFTRAVPISFFTIGT